MTIVISFIAGMVYVKFMDWMWAKVENDSRIHNNDK